MTELHKIRKKKLSLPMPPRQIGIAFESTGLLGLTSIERMKAVIHLSHLLMQAAGVAATESIDER
jgi:hypothetical protein